MIHLYDFTTGKERLKITGHENGVYSVAFSPDGTALLSASVDKTIRIWDVADGKQLLRLDDPQIVIDANFTRDGRFVVSGGNDQIVKVWSLETSSTVQTLEPHPGEVRCVVVSPDGHSLVSVGTKATARYWKRQL